ncbi:hypothetical protein DUI87_16059 [Hirundo rustica rustica]|uniref:Uncharacterized protein n=1 Tax=Hirundo rustica rustica TaxID=333673 RepID=A0A3M0K2K4_HIRRU|nr:hypothetical protein DUI87_16059 [Hirundo rustica rustica]
MDSHACMGLNAASTMTDQRYLLHCTSVPLSILVGFLKEKAQGTVVQSSQGNPMEGHGEMGISMLVPRPVLNPFSAQPGFMLGLSQSRWRTLAPDLVELPEVCMVPPLRPVQFPLDAIPSFQHGDHTTEFGVTRKLTEGALDPTVHVTDKGANRTDPNTDPEERC